MTTTNQEIMESQLIAIELLYEMYGVNQEVEIDPIDLQWIHQLKETNTKPTLFSSPKKEIKMVILLDQVDLQLTIGLFQSNLVSIRVREKKMNSISRSQLDQLNQEISDSIQLQQQQEQDTVSQVLCMIELVQSHSIFSSPPEQQQQDSHHDDNDANLKIVRGWYYLPTLSSTEKRADLVNYAKEEIDPPITGFVLAGKPALVVLEHPLNQMLDRFWSRIKSTSWADIPAGHKKVSERLREVDSKRAFTSFDEVTEWQHVNGKEVIPYGGKRNKSDLGKVQVWLEQKQLGGRLEKVLGTEWKGVG